MKHQESSRPRVFKIPSLPESATRVLRSMRHVHVDLRRLVRIMETDPAWAADLLRTANSSLWGLNGAASSLAGAVDLLGLRRVHQLVAISAVRPLLLEPLPAYELGAGELWNHSIATAVATREILFEKGLKPCEEAFTAGLLHEVGKLVIGNAVVDEPDAIFGCSDLEGLSFEEAETRVLQINHAEAGAVLLEHWNMPTWVVEAVRFHHAPPDYSCMMADLIHLADALSLSAGVGAGRDGLHYRLSPEVSLRWNLSRRSVERILGRTMEALDDAKDLVHSGRRR